jgi:Arc/MetJ-type ribon-helix-helix transcriptional regulator
MGRKVKTSISLDQDLVDWIYEMVKLKRFGNTTHAIEYALQRLKEQERQELHVAVFQEASQSVPNQSTNKSEKDRSK